MDYGNGSSYPGVTKTFTVYDFRKDEAPRMMGDEKHPERLERYAFEKRSDGSFWAFLGKLTEKYPAVSYGYMKEELAGVDGLMEFLGFSDFGNLF